MMLAYALVALLAATSGAIPTATSVTGRPGGPEVTDQAHGVIYQGTLNNGVESFLNIRFGKDTGGQARFTPPQLYTYPRNAVVNATANGAACPQSNVTNISEDCLTLRVDRVQNTTADTKLPVMVFLYGGGWSIGEIYDPNYNPIGLLGNAAKSGFPVVYAAIK